MAIDFALFVQIGYSQSQPTITTEQILATSTCSGQFLAVTYSTTGNFNWGNQFRAELSNGLGFFNNPVVIGWVPFNTGVIPAQIPINTGLGIYRIRVVSTNPPVTGTPAQQPLLITNIPQATQIFTWPDDTVCEGDSIRLSVAPVFTSVQWSTGAATSQIYVKTSGTYSVKTFDLADCEGRDTVKVEFKECPHVVSGESFTSRKLDVFPNPCTDFAVVRVTGFKAPVLVLTDISGRVVLRKHMTSDIMPLNLTERPAGLYRLELCDGDNQPMLRTSVMILK